MEKYTALAGGLVRDATHADTGAVAHADTDTRAVDRRASTVHAHTHTLTHTYPDTHTAGPARLPLGLAAG